MDKFIIKYNKYEEVINQKKFQTMVQTNFPMMLMTLLI
jgi:hypothetical protein